MPVLPIQNCLVALKEWRFYLRAWIGSPPTKISTIDMWQDKND
ncbi:hypothetical protein PLUTE_a4034 [Pseudoalteromonas luteoviolacea DSM 6061]|nr:hypothetical protein [Pseudoalteromonas luteoviolacea DSM 6061]